MKLLYGVTIVGLIAFAIIYGTIDFFITIIVGSAILDGARRLFGK